MMNSQYRARDFALRRLSIQQTSRMVELLAVGLVCCLLSSHGSCGDLQNYEWDLVDPQASWDARAGLQVVELNDQFLLMGGRTPRPPSDPPIPGDSDIWADVWSSDDRGESWNQILATDSDQHWSARAYFQAVTKDERIYVLGGQDFSVIENSECPPFPTGCPPFISTSNFFNDVWSSSNGIDWTLESPAADWEGRAGLSSVVFNDEIYVMGGSKNDDSSIIGGPPERIYFNDVWKSPDGVDWELVTDSAVWAPRAGAIAVVKDDYIYLLGGEDGFTCDSGPRCPPYYNDVYRTQDGETWELVTPSADWQSRPGHQVVVVEDQFVLFGGFGLSTDPGDPFQAANPVDMWTSSDGVEWQLLDQSPWNAAGPEEVKYDFAALVIEDGPAGTPAVYTFGGDRETFDFTDPTNYLNVDNDVWRFSFIPEPSTLLLCLCGLFFFHPRRGRR